MANTRRDNEAENPKEPLLKPVMQTGWRWTIVAVAETQGEEDRPLGTLGQLT